METEKKQNNNKNNKKNNTQFVANGFPQHQISVALKVKSDSKCVK